MVAVAMHCNLRPPGPWHRLGAALGKGFSGLRGAICTSFGTVTPRIVDGYELAVGFQQMTAIRSEIHQSVRGSKFWGFAPTMRFRGLIGKYVMAGFFVQPRA